MTKKTEERAVKPKKEGQGMGFNFAQKMEDMCSSMLNAKKDRTIRCKEIVQETNNFLEGFHHNFLQPVRQDFQAASTTFKRFAKECSKVH